MKQTMRLKTRVPETMASCVAISFLVLAGCAQKPEKAASQTEPATGSQPMSREDWQKALSQVPKPKKGCFTSTYPSMEWQEVPCTTPPPVPQIPRRGHRLDVVGGGNDIVPRSPSGFISTAIGSFDSVSGVTSESGKISNMGSPVANAYTLQFVFYNSGSAGVGYIEYWLIKYNTTCPSGWMSFVFSGGTETYCVRNATRAVSVPNQPITNLGNLVLTGEATASGDGITVFDGTTARYATGDNSVNASAGWTDAEFNVLGPGGNSSGGSQAVFNSGASIVARSRVIYGGTGQRRASPRALPPRPIISTSAQAPL